MNPLVRSTTVAQVLPKEEIKYAFDITKADQISDHLLKDKQIKLLEGYKNPSMKELNEKKYCKWHNRWSHITKNCLVLWNAIQKIIMEGRLKFLKEIKESC